MTGHSRRLKVGFIGLGAIGLPIAQRLAEAAPVELAVFDLSGERMAAAAGTTGRAASSVADAVAGADLAVTVLPADQHVQAVVADILTVAGPQMLYMDCSTIRPATIDDVACQLATHGVRTASVALTRGALAARAGTLALYVGHDGPVPEQLQPLFAAMADEVRLVAGLGGAKAVKIANNMVMSGINAVIADAAALACRAGISMADLAVALGDAGVDSWVLRTQITRHVLNNDLGPQYFSTVNMLKDVSLYLGLAHDTGCADSLAAAAAGYYRGMIAAGRGADYHPAVVAWQIENARGATARVDLPHAAEVLPKLVDTVAAGQLVASTGPLSVLARSGVAPETGVINLRGATGDNAALGPVAAFLNGDHNAVDTLAVIAGLSAGVDLATKASLPAHALAGALETAYTVYRR